MKQILISIKPKWVAKILNREKTIEIRKTAPKEWADYLNGKTDKMPEPMIVNIYCTKGDKEGLVFDKEGKGLINKKLFPYAENCPENDRLLNGKVVARFTLKDVYGIYNSGFSELIGKKTYFAGRSIDWGWKISESTLLKDSCLLYGQLDAYLKGIIGYAWRISDLEIFDAPKELSDFYIYREPIYVLERAPQNWCYVEEYMFKSWEWKKQPPVR